LLDRVKGFNFRLYCTDDWGAYDRLLPEDKHLITQTFTQSIERQNLNFRTRIKRLQRKTICFSKSVEMHDKVIGEFINREFFSTHLKHDPRNVPPVFRRKIAFARLGA